MDYISNTRLRNLKEKTLRYNFKMIHIPGIKHRAPDTLSWIPTGDPISPKLVLQDDIYIIEDSHGIALKQPLHIPTQLIAGVNTDD